MEEVWRQVPRFPDYEASTQGNVRNKTTQRHIKFHVNGGYCQGHLYNRQKRYPVKLHRIIAETFIDNPENKEHVNHKNKKRQDNRLENLEWVTVQENNEHKVSVSFNKKQTQCRKVWKCNPITHERIECFDSIVEAAKAFNKQNIKNATSCIRKVFSGFSKQTHGFFWEYDDYPIIEGEFWKPLMFIPKIEGYEVSSEGRLKDKNGKMYFGHKDEHGYIRVSINLKLYRMHILVAKTFLPNFRNKPHVNHKDGKKDNNRLYNLEWSTRSENMQHAYNTGLNKGPHA